MAIGNPISLTNNIAEKTSSQIAAANQAQFIVPGGYLVNKLGVYRNGVKLSQSSDYTANDGDTVNLVVPANDGDVIQFQVFDYFNVADAITTEGGTVSGTLTVEGSIVANGGVTGDLTGDVTGDISGATATFTGDVSIGGTLTYEDVTNIDSVGIITARSGVVVSSGSSIGIGLNDPISILQIEKIDATVYDDSAIDGQVSVGPTIYLNNGANANNTVGGQIVFGMRSTEEQARIGATGGSSPALTFGTADAERMRIDSSGDVGIGTDSPSSTLHVSDDQADLIRIERKSNLNAAIRFSNTAGSMYSGLNSGATGFVVSNNVNLAVTPSFFVAKTSGNVGIGTDSPNRTLHVQGDFGLSGRAHIGDVSQNTNNLRDSQTTINRTPKVQINSESGPNSGLGLISWHGDPGGYYSPQLWLAKSNASDDTVGTNTLVTDGTDLGAINFAGNDGATFLNAASIRAEVDGTAATDDMPGRLVFYTNGGAVDPTESMRINSSGNVGIGTDNIDGKLHSVGGVTNGVNVACVLTGGTAGGAGALNTDEVQLRMSTNNSNADIRGAWISALNTTGSTQGHDLLLYTNPASSSPVERVRINSSGNVGIETNNPTEKLHVIGNILASGNITAFSDIKLKDNIEVIPNALDKVVQIRGVTFDRIDEEVPRQSGVIAQEVEKVLPEVVITNKNGIKSVAYGNLVGLLIESIKELKVEVNELKARLEE